MLAKYKIDHLKYLYIFFIFLSLNLFFFSTAKGDGNAFDINNIEISKPFEINFNKNEVMDDGFNIAFFRLVSLIVDSANQKKIKDIKLNEIKGMIDSFSIKEEKFIDEIYHLNLGVSFSKKKVFNYLEKKNIFPSIPIRKKILLIPIIIDENKKDLLIFNNNNFFTEWNNEKENFHLIEYILPSEDLEDLNLIKSKYDFIEKYNFEAITKKYNLDDSIVVLIFKNENELRVLSRISIKNNLNLKNQSFSNINLYNENEVKKIIYELKTVYEDYWKNLNLINTSIRLTLKVKVDNKNNSKISNFEKILSEKDLIYDFYISKMDKNSIYYQITFNGTPDNFLKSMGENNYNFDTQNKTWILK